MRAVYLFLDESGNFDFSSGGTPYFLLGCVVYRRPSPLYAEVMELRYDLMEEGHDIDRFHATDDRQAVRDRVFEVIGRHLDDIRVHALVVEKAKAHPKVRDVTRFYPEMLGYLLRYVVGQLRDFDEVIIITDALPINKQKRAVEKAVKTVLAEMLPGDVRYRIYHHDSRSNIGLQIADYCTWAIQRKWRDGDERSYALIRRAVRSEFDIYRKGATRFY